MYHVSCITRELPFVLCLKISTLFFPSIYHYPSIHPSGSNLSIHPSISHPSTHPHIYYTSFIHSFIHPLILLPICLSVHQSIHLHIHCSFIPTNLSFPHRLSSSFLPIQKLATTSAYHARSQLRDTTMKASFLSQLNPRGRTHPSQSTLVEGKCSPDIRDEDQSSRGGNTQVGCGGMGHMLLGTPSF